MSDNKHEIDISKLTFEQLKKIRTYLKKLIDNGGSDLHVKANGIIRARINGNIVPFSGNVQIGRASCRERVCRYV